MPFYTMERTNKPVRNYQKKKYYTNRNVKPKKEYEYYFDTQKNE